ncbi:hypothetical protein [Oceanimonas doudoroffii]|uniref:hypothetical protein n=1 Tax=Oceanimonas doudoroffii TaxID=84158 RepID=UPI0011404030|nr:hypothetical protein [Oceanimonas doudoroffii]
MQREYQGGKPRNKPRIVPGRRGPGPVRHRRFYSAQYTTPRQRTLYNRKGEDFTLIRTQLQQTV